MKVFIPAAILLLAAVALADMTDEYKSLILDYHTRVRKSRHASNMHKLDWDDKLEGLAEDWVSKCVFEHENKGHGENLAFDMAPKDTDYTAKITTALDSWYNESVDFERAGGNRPCGQSASCHYTQMVWHSDRLIGCAYHICEHFDGRIAGQQKNIFYFGCWYYPKGNWVENGKMEPFKTGPAGSECEEGETVEDGLCTGTPKCKDKKKDGCLSSEAMDQCESNKAYMEKACQQTCEFCTGGDPEVCGNKLNATCDQWVSDKVRADTRRMRQTCVTAYMYEGCRMACGFCGKKWKEVKEMYQ